jgi:hypothetical protein
MSINQDDIDAFEVDLTAEQRADLAALADAADRLRKGVVGGREAPAQDIRPIIMSGILGWTLYAKAIADQYQAGLDAMEMHGKRSDAKSGV